MAPSLRYYSPSLLLRATPPPSPFPCPRYTYLPPKLSRARSPFLSVPVPVPPAGVNYPLSQSEIAHAVFADI